LELERQQPGRGRIRPRQATLARRIAEFDAELLARELQDVTQPGQAAVDLVVGQAARGQRDAPAHVRAERLGQGQPAATLPVPDQQLPLGFGVQELAQPVWVAEVLVRVPAVLPSG
jgi:hypothetical protein